MNKYSVLLRVLRAETIYFKAKKECAATFLKLTRRVVCLELSWTKLWN